MSFNIYFAGADATRKTTLAYMLRDFLRNQMGKEAFVQSFPSEVGTATGLIRQHLNGRMSFDFRTLALLFAADRLEASAFILEKIHQRNPNAIFVFDRGPLNGRVYAAATAPDGEDPVSIMRWMDDCDSVFLKKYPVNIGFILGTPMEESIRRMDSRSTLKEKDTFDSDTRLQMKTRQLFNSLQLGEQWHRIEIPDPTGNMERDFAEIKVIVRGKLREEGILREGVGVRREQ